ncbi:LOW QUALITY PROTEIN: hypothetical protein Cgig2_027246 [Carnegiea gigantea]|uniref:Reverse transcriptase zinc-binding domain-containing protein n=1 Tax=Carnegiea gigantea TaxID=171969 RepID=A0A9Q1K1P4_9CARY|nr:LOW QUALITY PROTEIN: hypothetical protein Cgig2_027246 [Carnegiea gigantea]
MASGLEQELLQPKLTEEEEEIIDATDVDSEEVLSILVVTLREAVNRNLLILALFDFEEYLEARKRFFCLPGKDFIINEGPWSFDGKILLLTEVSGLEQPSKIRFPMAHFWVKAYDIPGRKKKTYHSCCPDDHLEDWLSLWGVMRLQCSVDIDVVKPLIQGVRILVDKNPFGLRLDFCYGCGKLDHVYLGCDLYNPQCDETKLQYGEWLRPSPLKPRTRSVEADIKEEKKLFLVFKHSKTGSKARIKLNFDGPVPDSSQNYELKLDCNLECTSHMIVYVIPLSWLVMKFRRGRSNYLKYRDSNTRWFHSRANMRKARNYIAHLVDDQGVRHTDEGDIEVNVYWQKDPVREYSLPIDADVILNLPQCALWPRDKLIWHYCQDSSFSVHSAYHMIVEDSLVVDGSSSCPQQNVWRSVRSLCLPPCIKLFAWRIWKGILPTGCNIAPPLPSRNIDCSICGNHLENGTHALLKYPLALQVLEGGGLDRRLWATRVQNIEDCVVRALRMANLEVVGDFIDTLWEIWNTRNHFIFHKPDQNLEALSNKAISYVKSSASGGFVIRNHLGDVLAGAEQGSGFPGPTVEEALACLLGLHCARKAGSDNVMIACPSYSCLG